MNVPKEPDTELARRDLLLNALLSLSPDMIVTIDRRGIIQSIGAAATTMFGYSGDELIGENVNLMMPSPHHDRHDAYIARYVETHEPHIIGVGRKVEARHKDGSLFPVFIRVAEVWDGGEPLFVGLLHDLTEEERAKAREEEMRTAMQHMARVASMGELATGLAHEINQPLAAINQYLSAASHQLSEKDADIASALEFIEKANRQTERTGDIIRSLRRFVRFTGGEKTRCALEPLIREAVDLSLLESEKKRIAVELDIPEDLPAVRVEPVQIQQVLHNLLRNSVEALSDAEVPLIRISAKPHRDTHVQICVEDTGTGIDPKLRDDLFDRFVSGNSNGLGIGLAICRSIVTAHGGTIWAEDRPANGARLCFAIPASTEG
ncbi:MAG: sensor histidine kinase [Parasphingopyxis sp.]|uniref:sensor histidine kinase n=1 Tax=Parasphingopyxis sp. TaxID=1920299 RepID=UPI003F9F2828